MTIKEAINRAIDEGYEIASPLWGEPTIVDCGEKVASFSFPKDSVRQRQLKIRVSDILLDPLFWQALGKSMGMYVEDIRPRYEAKECQHNILGDIETQSVQPVLRLPKKQGDKEERWQATGICEVCHWKIYTDVEGWKLLWYEFTHHLIEGGTIESYFEQL